MLVSGSEQGAQVRLAERFSDARHSLQDSSMWKEQLLPLETWRPLWHLEIYIEKKSFDPFRMQYAPKTNRRTKNISRDHWELIVVAQITKCFFHFHSIFISLFYVWGYVFHGECAEVRIQFAGNGSLPVPRGSWGWTLIIGFDGGHFYLWNHLWTVRTFFTLAACMRTVFWIHDTESIAAKETTIELELMEFKAFKVLQRICRRKHRRRKSYMRISAKKSVSKMCKELFNFIIKTINQFKNGQKSWENLAAEIKIC